MEFNIIIAIRAGYSNWFWHTILVGWFKPYAYALVLYRRRRFDFGVGLSNFYRLLFLSRDEEIDDANSEQPLSD